MNELKEAERRELEYIIKSHACTQVNYDKASSDDYPKMIDKLIAFIEVYTAKKELETECNCFVYMTPERIQDYKNHKHITYSQLTNNKE